MTDNLRRRATIRKATYFALILALFTLSMFWRGVLAVPFGNAARAGDDRKFGDGLTRYELADEESHHDHLICTSCAKIIEFEEPKIEELQEKIATRHGFELISHKHEMYGTCADCIAKGHGKPNARRSGN